MTFAEKVKELVKVRDEIDAGVAAEYNGESLPCNFLDEIIEKYGLAKVREVVAITIKNTDYDGRYSITNKQWAKDYETDLMAYARYEVELRSHRCLVDAIASELRRR